MRMYEIAVAAPLGHTLTYGQPEDLAGPLPPGLRVLVPLGRRLVTGYILGRAAGDEAEQGAYTIRPIAEVLDQAPIFPAGLIPFYRWVADYYHFPIGEMIRTALPGGLTATSGRRIRLMEEGRAEISLYRQQDGGKDAAWLDRLLEKGELTAAAAAAAWRRPARQRLLKKWEKNGWLTIKEEVQRRQFKVKTRTIVRPGPQLGAPVADGPAGDSDHRMLLLAGRFPDLKKSELKTLALFFDLCRRPGVSSIDRLEITRHYSGAAKALRSLHEAEILLLEDRRVYRDPFGEQPPFFPPPEHLTSEQEEVLARLLPAVREQEFQTFLLHGVTGCGKTEVYLRATAVALEAGHTVLVLVPEIALASQIEAHFYSRFGDLLAVLHSGLNAGERHDQWQRITTGQARIVVGARSAVFAPLQQPGLIIVDEEHEPAYKQEDGLRYNGRDLAILRARFAGCPVLLGSATPSVTSYYHARTGKYQLLTMARRIHDQTLPKVHIVDLGRDRKSRPDLFFSDQLISALWENMEKRRQSLLFVNRRGFASFMMCRDCGHIIQCPHCQVSLTLHRHQQRLVCHYCGYSRNCRVICPSCGSTKVDGLGLGTERIEEEVRQVLPHARVARLDSDTAAGGKHYLATLRAVRRQEIDILVGTQMIAKGLHFPNMTLVGVVWADSGLAMPDFRASERTFQLLAQVAGRAGRGDAPGRVVIQTHQPRHYTVLYAQQHDYRKFYEHELALRTELGYPPFSRLVNIRMSSSSEERVKQCAEQVAGFLKRSVGCRGWRDIEILGPAPAPLARLKDKSRWQVMIKSNQPALLHDLCARLLAGRSEICPHNVKLTVDVDPENMM